MLIRWFDTTLDLLALHRRFPRRYPFLLESAVTGTPQSRYSLLLGRTGESLVLEADGQLTGPHAEEHGRFIDALDAWWAIRKEPPSRHADLLPFRGGWFLYFGYELAGELEPTLQLPPPSQSIPTALAVRCGIAFMVDHATGRSAAVAEPGFEFEFERMLGEISDWTDEQMQIEPLLLGDVIEDPGERYEAGVAACKQYIRNGDVFQVNLSRGWRVGLEGGISNAELYDRLRTANPAPFASLAEFGDWSVIGSSPERLVATRDGHIDTRPIAGTRPRGLDAGDDERLSAELIGHPKERAEHVMLIDLERNDLGRVCNPGSIHVDELMTVESYRHVHHIVSNVSGTLKAGVTPGQIVRAVFPGGTITGCPKVRCMEIIAELETEGRGAYTGSLGYLNRDGDMDLNILIRSMTRCGSTLRFRTGAGIVADSDPHAELVETRHKARGLLRALEQKD